MKYVKNDAGCWVYQGRLDKDGYGKILLKNGHFRAHRLMAHLTLKSRLSEFDIVAHRCDNPSCINPEHLFVTTALGNMQDRDTKGRGTSGEKSRLAKLTESQAKEIRIRFQNGESMGRISADYPVTYGAIQALVRGRTWKKLT